MRRLALLLAAPLLLVAACGSSHTSGTVTVSGTYGHKPTITVPKSDPPSTLTTKVLSEGKGATVSKGDLVEVNYLGVTWADGKSFDNSYDRGQPYAFPVGEGQVITGWDKGLIGKTIGSRVLLEIPPGDAYGDQAQNGIPGKSTLVFAVDLIASFPPGSPPLASDTPAQGVFPAVKASPTAAAQIAIKPGAQPPAPATTQVKVLVPGNGAVVKQGQVVYARYTGVLASNGKEFDDSFKHGGVSSFQIGVGRVIPGWDKAIVGQKAGSRLLLVIPPADGYGDQEQNGIPAKSTLVFVVDIVAAS